MKKLIGVLFAVALVFALVAFSSKLPDLPSIADLIDTSDNAPIPLDSSWPEEFSMFPEYDGGGKLTHISKGGTVMFRIYEDVGPENMETYFSTLEENGFTRQGNAATRVEGEQQYVFKFDRSSETRYQLNFSIETAPPPPPLETMNGHWSGQVNYYINYTAALVAPANEEGLVHSIYITAQCEDEWNVQELATYFGQEYENIQVEGTTITCELHSSEGFTFGDIRSRFSGVSEDFRDEIVTEGQEEDSTPDGGDA